MSFRYIMVIKVSDPTGETWVSVFNEHAEKIIGCSADELDRIRKEVNSILWTDSIGFLLFSLFALPLTVTPLVLL
jgi:hypothetical protein